MIQGKSTGREVPVAESSPTINKVPVVTKVLDQPVLGSVIKQKNVEIHNRPIIQEIHEYVID
jgi:hypothetical protein